MCFCSNRAIPRREQYDKDTLSTDGVLSDLVEV